MIVRSKPSMGIDPITALTAGAQVLNFLGNEFGGPTQQQILAAQQQAAAAQQQQLYTALALFAGGAILALLI
jgi:hypothetical protein